ncbi:hypothetical protein D9M71_513600 [compost metagenome]
MSSRLAGAAGRMGCTLLAMRSGNRPCHPALIDAWMTASGFGWLASSFAWALQLVSFSGLRISLRHLTQSAHTAGVTFAGQTANGSNFRDGAAGSSPSGGEGGSSSGSWLMANGSWFVPHPFNACSTPVELPISFCSFLLERAAALALPAADLDSTMALYLAISWSQRSCRQPCSAWAKNSARTC